MHQLENTLYVTSQGAYLRLEHETLLVEIEGKKKSQIPLHHLGGIVGFGNVLISPFLIHRCAEEGRAIVWLTKNGRFRGRLAGPASGNVLLRKAQYAAVEDQNKTLAMAAGFVAGKIKNKRSVLMRAAREEDCEETKSKIERAADRLARIIESLPSSNSLNALRGKEGDAAKIYYDVFSLLVRTDERENFKMETRSKRPPRDPLNAVLSFLYTMTTNDVASAIEGVGLDPQVGFLHTIRPGRPALALDMVEEFRPLLADRLALTLINRKQLNNKQFEYKTGGAVMLSEEGRKIVVVAYQERKQREVEHQAFKSKVAMALLPHLQARILARCIRGDLPNYIPYLQK